MKDEYIIINKTAIQKRIEELKQSIPKCILPEQQHLKDLLEQEVEIKVQILSQSIPLTPEIEKAFDAGRTVKNYKGEWKETFSDVMTSAKYEESKNYISNLKLDV